MHDIKFRDMKVSALPETNTELFLFFNSDPTRVTEDRYVV